MRYVKIGLLLLIAGLVYPYKANTQVYPGTNIRGRIDTFNPYIGTPAPAAGVIVELFITGPAPGQWIMVGKTVTDYAGFYYFSRVRPGHYVMRVAGRMNFTIAVVMIDYSIYQFQDLPPVLF